MTTTYKIISAEEIMNTDWDAEVKKQIVIRGKDIVMVEMDYALPLSDLDTHKKLLDWIYHLIGKVWFTKDMLDYFIRLVVKENNLDLYGKGRINEKRIVKMENENG